MATNKNFQLITVSHGQGSTNLVLVVFIRRTNSNLTEKSWWKSCINKQKPGQEWSRRVSVSDTDCLWQTKIVCDRHRLSVTDTDCVWETQTACERRRQSVPDHGGVPGSGQGLFPPRRFLRLHQPPGNNLTWPLSPTNSSWSGESDAAPAVDTSWPCLAPPSSERS